MSSEEAEQLRAQLASKDELLNSIREKTKVFVSKLKEDHDNALNELRQQNQVRRMFNT
jgi:hypothetical protein